jgi:hypothetical protein
VWCAWWFLPPWVSTAPSPLPHHHHHHPTPARITPPAVLIFKWANNTQDILSSFSRSSPSNTKSNHSNDISYFLSLSLSFSRARIWLLFVQHQRNEIIFLFSFFNLSFLNLTLRPGPKVCELAVCICFFGRWIWWSQSRRWDRRIHHATTHKWRDRYEPYSHKRAHTHLCVNWNRTGVLCSSCRVGGVVPKSRLNSLGPEWTRRCPSLLSYLASLVAVVGRMTESVISGV